MYRPSLPLAAAPLLLLGSVNLLPHAWPPSDSAASLQMQSAAAVEQQIDYADHFSVFTGQGEPASLVDVVAAMADVEVVLVGEEHTDPVGHWIQAEFMREALAWTEAGDESGMARPVALSLEMFERDVQGIVDEYLQDVITESQFKDNARSWTFYDDDYRVMVELAKEAGIPVIASNAPRRYVNRVTRLGRDAVNDLPAYGQSFLPPLPYPEPSEAYRSEWMALMASMPMQRECIPPGGKAATESDSVAQAHATEPAPTQPPAHMAAFMENGVQAQALWDAAMAHAITSHLKTNPDALVLHMVGGFHVKNFTGIPEKIQYYRPDTRSLVVSMNLADDFRSFDPDEHGGRGDFVILTDKSLDLEYARFCVDKDDS